MVRRAGKLAFSLAVLLLIGCAGQYTPWIHAESVVMFDTSPATPPQIADRQVPPIPAADPAPHANPSTLRSLEAGILIVISKSSQQLFVFKDGEAWASSPVSTGKKGHETPAGVFPILQKKVFHRSNLYSNAQMPYMQRLTWDGIALHAGELPGYPASHGCIRMPKEFAQKLYAITDFDSTVVLVTNDPVNSTMEARVAGADSATGATSVEAQEPIPIPGAAAPSNRSQTIQLAATPTSRNANEHWQRLVQRRPVLGRLQPQVIPATVHSRKVFRLRASGADAHAICKSLMHMGEDCFNVRN